MKIKKTLWFILLSVLWLPLIQAAFGIWKNTFVLKGAFVNHPEPVFSDTGWFSGTFQKNYEEFINDSIGFHNPMIGVRNQLDYSLFNKCHAYDIELGKDGYLVATTHFEAILGKTTTAVQHLDTLIKNFVFLADTLEKLNKKLTVIFAPSKGSYCLDKAPGW